MLNQSDINFKSVLNFRDIGGIVSEGEKPVRNGTIYRSANLDRISRSDIKKLQSLNIKTIIDLRAQYERKKNFRTIENIERISFTLDFEKTTREKLTPHLYKKNSEEIIADISNSLYLEILDAARPVITEVMKILLSPDRCPILIHCQAGKDRTGILCALIQLALKVERELIIEDYLKSNDSLIPYFKKLLLIRKVLSFGFFPSGTILYAITVKKRNIESVLDRINNHYGGIEGYLNSAGLDGSHLVKLRERLVVN